MKKQNTARAALLFLFLWLLLTGLYADTNQQVPGNGKTPTGRILREITPRQSFTVANDTKREFALPGGKGNIVFPANSLDTTQELVVWEVELEYDKTRFHALGHAFRFGPEGTRFKQPVLLTLPYAEPDFPEEFVQIYYYDCANNRWKVMSKVSQDKENNLITAKIGHFSDYMPGTGSYSINEGLAPNSHYFQNNNESVDPYAGQLHINRTELSLGGRGSLDFTLETAFSSDGYYWNYTSPTSDKYWEAELEDLAPYKIANGWRFKLPAFLHENIWLWDTGFHLVTPSGTIYNLENVIEELWDKGLNTLIYLDGCRAYNTTWVQNGAYDTEYTAAIELIREKMVLKCYVENPPWPTEKTVKNVYLYTPDGKVWNFNAYIKYDKQTINTPGETRGDDGTDLYNYYFYDNFGRLTRKYAKKGTVETNKLYYTYDRLGRVLTVKTTIPGSSTQKLLRQYGYNDTNNILMIRNVERADDADAYAEGDYVVKTYDGLDRLAKEESYAAYVSGYLRVSCKTYEYHPVYTGKLIKTTVYKNHAQSSSYVTETVYDKLGRAVGEKVAGSTVSTITYYPANNEITVKKYRDNTQFTQQKTKKDWNGRVTDLYEWSIVSPGSDLSSSADIHTQYSYDYAGNKTGLTNPAGEVFVYAYDTLGQLSRTTYADSTTELYEYDKKGNLTAFTDRKEQQKIMIYDTTGCLRTTKFYDNTASPELTILTDYDVTGGAATITGKDGYGAQLYCHTYDYDGLGQLEVSNQSVGETGFEKEYAVINTYYDNGQLATSEFKADNILVKSLEYPPDVDVSLNGVVTRVAEENATDDIVGITGNFWGGVDHIDYGDNVMTTTFAHNTYLRPSQILNSGLMDLDYVYDRQGNVTDWTNATGTITVDRDFTYDGLERLKTEIEGTKISAYTYDAIGNRLTLVTTDGSTPVKNYDFDYDDTYNKMQLTDYAENVGQVSCVYGYDDNGNIISKADGTNREYVYDTQNRLVEVKAGGSTVGQYFYDASGLRYKKIEGGKTTVYVYSGQSILFEETYDTDNQYNLGTAESRELNVSLNGMNLAKFVGAYDSGWNYELQYHLLDHLGSRQVVTDDDGSIITGGDVDYASFGGQENGTGGEYSFTGKKLDGDTGLVYYNARYYDPVVGRFVTIDPIKDGMNWYNYANNNPLKFVDNNGLNAALVNFRTWASDFGHSSAFVQDKNGIWYAFDIAGRAGDDVNHFKESIESTDTLRHWFTNTKTTDLVEAINVIEKKLDSKDLHPTIYKAIEFETGIGSEADTKIFDKMKEFDTEFNKGDALYYLIGNSCIDNSFDIIKTGLPNLPENGIWPNLNYDVYIATSWLLELMVGTSINTYEYDETKEE